jgi:electron transport complex protein RnfB
MSSHRPTATPSTVPSTADHRTAGPPVRPSAPEVAHVDLHVCDRCGLCLPLCPPEAIHLAFDELVVDRDACTGCRKCIAPCPVGALAMAPA